MKQIMELKNIMEKYIVLIDQLIDFECKKLDAIAANNVELLDVQMREEQAYLLKLKGLDKKRETLLQSMNMEDLTFKEILDTLSGETKDVLQVLFYDLSRKTEEMKDAANSTKHYIELHLHSLNLLISKLGGNSDAMSIYNKSGSPEPSKVSRFESKKV